MTGQPLSQPNAAHLPSIIGLRAGDRCCANFRKSLCISVIHQVPVRQGTEEEEGEEEKKANHWHHRQAAFLGGTPGSALSLPPISAGKRGLQRLVGEVSCSAVFCIPFPFHNDRLWWGTMWSRAGETP